MSTSAANPAPTPAFSLGRATVVDAADLSSIAALTFPLACPPELPAADVAAFVEASLKPSDFTRYLLDPTNIVLLARDDVGDPLGYVLAIPGDAMDPAAAVSLRGSFPLGVSKFYAAPRAQGTGLSTAMLSLLVDAALQATHDSLWLATNVDNGRARRFYEREGFAPVGSRTFAVGGQRCEDVVFERLLEG